MKISQLFETNESCPHCGGHMTAVDEMMEGPKDACYYKIKASSKVWPSAYASGRLVQCRKKGAGNYGNKSEDMAEAANAAQQAAIAIAKKKKKSLQEGSVKDQMHDDADSMSRAEFVKKHGKEHGDFWDNIRGDLDESAKKEGVAEAFGPLPKDNQQIRLGRYRVEFERVGLDKDYIGFAWHDSKGKEHYEEVPVGDLGSYDDLIDKIKQEISHQERQYTDKGVAEGLDELSRILDLSGLALTADQQFDIIESMVESWALHHGVDAEQIWEDFESVDDAELLDESAAWHRSAGKSKKGGLNAKGVASYRREHPGSKLQMAVTTKPSKLKPGSKAAKRRKSFCARMGGNKGPMKKPNGKPTRKALALRKWNC